MTPVKKSVCSSVGTKAMARVVTPRSILLGLLSVILISLIVPYFKYTMASSQLGADHLHIAALFLAFAYLIFFNVFLGRWKKDWA